MDNNKGLFGLVNYEDTPLEIKNDDTFCITMLKGSGRAVIEGAALFGTFCLVASGVDFIKLVKK